MWKTFKFLLFRATEQEQRSNLSFALWDNFVVFTVKQKVFRTTAFLFCFAEFAVLDFSKTLANTDDLR